MNIIHIFRAPVGGLFRHVVDLATGQIARGHRVGIVADSLTGDSRSREILEDLAPMLALGLTRIPMQRRPGLADISAVRRVSRRIKETAAEVVHGHGAKGGALARLALAPQGTVRGYTPHGGSLHDHGFAGTLYMLLERVLKARGNLYLFESRFSHDTFVKKIGQPPGTVRIIHNGVSKAEFAPIPLQPDATDIVFIGELRALKGVDVLIAALDILRQKGRRTTATIVGAGEDAAALREQVAHLGLTGAVRFEKPMPAGIAMALGRVMVVPSRAESLPYVVLEAAAAGKPLVATKVGGVPEIFASLAPTLVPAGDAESLAHAIMQAIDNPAAAERAAQQLQGRIATSFSVERMVEAVLASYTEERHRRQEATWSPRTLASDNTTE